MSIAALNWVWTHSNTKGVDRLMLLALADYANEDFVAWPSIGTLALKVNITRRYVIDVLARLESKGEIAVHRERKPDGLNRSNVYKILCTSPRIYPPGVVNPSSLRSEPQFTTGSEPQFTTPLEPEPVEGPGVVDPSSLRSEPQFTTGSEPQFTRVVNPSSPEPSFNHQLNPSMIPLQVGEAGASPENGNVVSGIEISSPPNEPVSEPAAPANGQEKPPRESALSAGQRSFLEAFGARRFKTTAQRDAVLSMEQKFGTTALKEGVEWAAKRGLGLGDAVLALESALPTWGRRERGRSTSRAAPSAPAAPATETDQMLEYLRLNPNGRQADAIRRRLAEKGVRIDEQ